MAAIFGKYSLSFLCTVAQINCMARERAGLGLNPSSITC